MKLYTEEQVKKAINDSSLYSYINGDFEFKNSEDDIINSLTPIELPSDEWLLLDATTWLHKKFNGKGIEFKIYDREKNEAFNYNPIKLLKEYSIWIRDKIKGGNK